MTRTTGRAATIVGAGIGGLATALALGRDGWTTDVRERASSLDPAGTGLVLAPNAVWALRALGVAEQVAEEATVLTGTALRAADGRWLSRVRTADVAARCGAPALGVVRSHLVDVLADAVGHGAVRLGHDVTDPEELDGDLVVGADGIGSVVRRTWWPDRRPRYAGYTAWRALVGGLDAAPGAMPGLATETWGRGERFGVVPVGRGQVYVYATAAAPPRADLGDDHAELRRRFGRWHDPIPQLLEALADAQVLRHDIHDVDGLGSLHRTGPTAVALVGDAGHAMEPNLGQGAGTALEDAVELAHWLGVEASTDAGLERYSRSRLPRVTSMASRSRQIGRLTLLTNPALVAARNGAVALTPDRLGRSGAVAVADWRPPTPTEEHP